MSKGSLQRPFDRERYEANYEKIFGKKKVCLSRDASGANCSSGDKSEYCEDCRLNPDASEVQNRFFCMKKGEPLDG